MFKCLNCNIEFDEPFRVRYTAKIPLEDDEVDCLCPACGSDLYRELHPCEYCGADTEEEDNPYCPTCYGVAKKLVHSMVKEAIDIFGEDMLDVIDDLLDGNSVRDV